MGLFNINNIEPFRNFGVGFDEIFNEFNAQIEKLAANKLGYPPYNIRKEGDNKYVIELAVAGFGENEIHITVDEDKLVVEGKVESKQEDDNENYLYHGIAGRSFKRVFALADRVEVKNATLANGMLKIWLENLHKLRSVPVNVPINGPKEDSKNTGQQLLKE